MFMVYKPAFTLWINKPFGKFLLGWQTKGKNKTENVFIWYVYLYLALGKTKKQT